MFNSKIQITPEQARVIAGNLLAYAHERERLTEVIDNADEQMNNAIDALKSIGALK
jgi:hypothetical protein